MLLLFLLLLLFALFPLLLGLVEEFLHSDRIGVEGGFCGSDCAEMLLLDFGVVDERVLDLVDFALVGAVGEIGGADGEAAFLFCGRGEGGAFFAHGGGGGVGGGGSEGSGEVEEQEEFALKVLLRSKRGRRNQLGARW